MDPRRFVEFALQNNALQFGRFTLKSGRISPYFFNTGNFNQGGAFNTLGRFYAHTLAQSQVEFDMLFGPAYKGIPLATAAAIALNNQYQRSVAVAFNRKEAKSHGEAGQLMGAPLAGRVVIIDDVITAGTAIRESMQFINQAGARAAAVVVALDRQEKGPAGQSAVQEVEKRYKIPVLAIARLQNLLEFTRFDKNFSSQLEQLTTYRKTYGIE